MSDEAAELEPIISQLTITALNARIAELEAELAHARLAFGKLIVRHTNLDPDDTWDAMMDEIRARPAP